MDFNTWMSKLKSWGVSDGDLKPNTALVLQYIYISMKWLLIAATVIVLVSSWFLISIVASALRGK